ncbi:hypothetical protein [Paludibacterium denitrificans]|uniref:Uncharacterized protein n=1 Tax=Paludibacterium denitrificans TaxID=2675226 RepID=A0A844GFK8_9NEIS|nr:hypothetical protein [Paludibacterium denitrificans]MTD33315.1 hypothetical protein [Paludibacterium denitrificans]
MPSEVMGFHRNLPLYLSVLAALSCAPDWSSWLSFSPANRLPVISFALLSGVVLIVGLAFSGKGLGFLQVFHVKWLRPVFMAGVAWVLFSEVDKRRIRISRSWLFFAVVLVLWCVLKRCTWGAFSGPLGILVTSHGRKTGIPIRAWNYRCMSIW